MTMPSWCSRWGPEASTEQLRYAASVGGNEFALVMAEGGLDWDPQRTAVAITSRLCGSSRPPVGSST